MGKNSGIDWTDHTWNPWQGCKKVSPGCENCYMYTDKKRYGQDPSTVVRSKSPTFNKPNSWKDPAKVFVCSWSDFFIEDADEWRGEAWQLIIANPHLTFQILTKRPENIPGRLPYDWPLENVWLGVTVENQDMAQKRIPLLLEIEAAISFLSMEPMLGPIRLLDVLQNEHRLVSTIDWIICGGESGPEARYMDPRWPLDILEQCHANRVPFFMKQMSGKSKTKRKDIPAILSIRQFPEVYQYGKY